MNTTIAMLLLMQLAPLSAEHDHAIRVMGALDYCLQPKGLSPLPETPVVLARCSDVDAQSWAFDRGRLKTLDQCLTVGPDAESGAEVVLNNCDDGAVAQWIVQDSRLELANTSPCLDIPFGLPDGAHVRVTECGLGLEQSFAVHAADDNHRSHGQVTLAQNAHACIAVQPNSAEINGTPITLATCDPSIPAEQLWAYAQGALVVMGRCLTAASPSKGAPVVISDCVVWTAQSWNMGAGGHFQLADRSLCLDALRNDPASNPQLVISPCEAESDTQQWVIPDDRNRP